LAKEDKAQKVKELAGEINDANLVVVTDFSSFDVKSLRALRIRLRENQTSYRVVKNNILRRAFKEVGAAEMEEHLTGPNAIAVAGGDAAGALKEMSAFLKENTEAVKAKRERGAMFLKVGLLDGKFVDSQGLIALSLLPSREVMLGILAGTLQAPISGMARALNGIICSLAFALKDLVGKGGAKQGTADTAGEKKEEAPEVKTEEKAEEKTEEKKEEAPEVKTEEKKEEASEEKAEEKKEEAPEEKTEEKADEKTEEKTEDKKED